MNRAKLDKTILHHKVKHKIQEFSIHFSKNMSKARAHLEDELELNNYIIEVKWIMKPN